MIYETPVLSVVVPVYNEERVLPLLFARLRPTLDSMAVSYEVVMIDDGSRDGTAAVVADAQVTWPQLRLIRLMRNSGHMAALTAGYDRAIGDYVVTIDADLQDPPETIGEMLAAAVTQQLDVVYGVRSDRSVDSIMKRITAQLYYRLMRRLAGPQVPHNAGDFRLVSRRVVQALQQLPEHARVYRLVVPWFGFPSGEVAYQRARRAAGTSKYPLSKMLRLAFDSITSFSAAPLRLATWLGGIGAFLCLTMICLAGVAHFMGTTVPGWASVILGIGLIGAVQLLCLGLMGEYIARLFVVTQGRPTYLIGYDSSHDREVSGGDGMRPRESPLLAQSLGIDERQPPPSEAGLLRAAQDPVTARRSPHL
jgi:polyisoprenyl-phosphate glycosyltransferase